MQNLNELGLKYGYKLCKLAIFYFQKVHESGLFKPSIYKIKENAKRREKINICVLMENISSYEITQLY